MLLEKNWAASCAAAGGATLPVVEPVEVGATSESDKEEDLDPVGKLQRLGARIPSAMRRK